MTTAEPGPPGARKPLPAPLFIAAIGLMSTVMAFGIFGRPWADWPLPLHYDGDALNVLLFVKAGMEQFWPWGSERLGAPGSLDLAVYPMPETVQLLCLKVLSLFTGTPAVAVNLYLFLTFFLTAASAAWALLVLGLPQTASALGALVFSLLPAHFWRGEGHMFVNGYYAVPVLCLLCVRGSTAVRMPLAVGAAVLAPLINTYYAFFFAVLLGVTALCDAACARSWQPLRRSALMLGGCAAGFLLNVARTLPLYLTHRMAFVRTPSDTELGGLKLAHMLLPAFETISSHAAQAAALYRQTSFLNGENVWNDLGLLGGCALLATLAMTFIFALRKQAPSPAQTLCLRAGLCVIVSILYGTQGGFSAIFSYLVVPFIRAANRIEPFIVFFSVAAALLLIQAHATNPRKSAALYAALVCVLYWDLNQKKLTPDLTRTNAIYEHDEKFFTNMEQTLPPGTHVFQLPYVLYPEGGPTDAEYTQARPFIHTHTLKWSYGIAHQTPAEKPAREATSALTKGDVATFAAYLRANNFDAVLLNRTAARLMHTDYEPTLDKAFEKRIEDDDEREFVLYTLPATRPRLLILDDKDGKDANRGE